MNKTYASPHICMHESPPMPFPPISSSRCLAHRAFHHRSCLWNVSSCRSWPHERFAHFSATSHPQSSHPTESMPPDYELQSYWRTRFVGEHHFEWLGDGADTILPHLRTYLLDPRTTARSSPLQPARLLHIGAGTSSLSERIRELYQDVYGSEVDERAIVHTDFAENLVARKQEKEASLAVDRPGRGMRWIYTDVMRWGELKAALDTAGEQNAFDLVVDKSTSDAISCGEDVTCSSLDPSLHPAINEYLAAHEGHTTTLEPVEVLAVHLASLVRPGGLWVALTFSSNRFPFLSSPLPLDPAIPRAGKYWEIEKVMTVDAPTGMEGTAHAPLVQHHVFLLRRREKGC